MVLPVVMVVDGEVTATQHMKEKEERDIIRM